MELAKCFDIHDKGIAPEIYCLLHCGAFIELKGNDTWYKISPFGDKDWDWEDGDAEDFGVGGWKNYDETEFAKSSEDRFREFANRRGQCLTKKTCAEALVKFEKFLKKNGITREDNVFVKIWW